MLSFPVSLNVIIFNLFIWFWWLNWFCLLMFDFSGKKRWKKEEIGRRERHYHAICHWSQVGSPVLWIMIVLDRLIRICAWMSLCKFDQLSICSGSFISMGASIAEPREVNFYSIQLYWQFTFFFPLVQRLGVFLTEQLKRRTESMGISWGW